MSEVTKNDVKRVLREVSKENVGIIRDARAKFVGQTSRKAFRSYFTDLCEEGAVERIGRSSYRLRRSPTDRELHRFDPMAGL